MFTSPTVKLWCRNILIALLLIATAIVTLVFTAGCDSLAIPPVPAIKAPPSVSVPVASVKAAGVGIRGAAKEIVEAAEVIEKKDPEKAHAAPIAEIRASTVTIAKNTDVIAKSVVTLEDHQRLLDVAIAEYRAALDAQQERLATMSAALKEMKGNSDAWMYRFLYILVGIGVIALGAGVFFVVNGSVKQGVMLVIGGASLSAASWAFIKYAQVFVCILVIVVIGAIGYTLYRNRNKVYEMATGMEALKPLIDKTVFKNTMNLAQSTETQNELRPVLVQVEKDLSTKST